MPALNACTRLIIVQMSVFYHQHLAGIHRVKEDSSHSRLITAFLD